MIAELQQKAHQVLTNNASAILTGVGVVGTVGTSVLAGRASFKASEIIKDKELEMVVDDEDWTITDKLPTKDRVLLVWPLFIPPVAVGGVTITSIVFANRISAKKAAALAAAYGISERSFQEYKEKAIEKLGINKEQKLRDEVAQDRVTKTPGSEVIIVGSGDVLCYDMLTGRYFQSSVEKINKAMTKIHSDIYHHMSASFSEFCDELGLPPTDYTDVVGWNTDDVPEVQFSTTTSPDDRPCITVSFTPVPHPDYGRFHE